MVSTAARSSCIEDSGYDPKKAVLATQKLIEKDKVFSMVGGGGSAPVLAAQDVVLEAGITQLFPLTAAEFTFKFDPAKPQERLKFGNLLPYIESTRAALKYMVETFKPAKPCIMYQDDEYGKNVLEGFEKQLDGDEAETCNDHEFQARRVGFQRPGFQDEVGRMRSGRAGHDHP